MAKSVSTLALLLLPNPDAMDGFDGFAKRASGGSGPNDMLRGGFLGVCIAGVCIEAADGKLIGTNG